MSEAPQTPPQAEPAQIDSATGSTPLGNNIGAMDSAESKSASNQPKSYNLNKHAEVIALLRTENDDLIKKTVCDHVANLIFQYGLDSYTPVFLFDDIDSISHFHANQIYEATSAASGVKDVLLFLQSLGGSIEPAYMLSKTCKRLAKEKFSVAIPRQAKSAATLIALGADEIHLGYMSELGPIDPQIDGYPALGLANALHKIANLACDFPKSADMWAAYLHKNLNLRDVGYLDRLSESAGQYAERLLREKPIAKHHTPQSLAKHFVEHYKDHGFVIDSDEAIDLLGSDIVKLGTKEYQCANEIYTFFAFFAYALKVISSKTFYYVGTVSRGLVLQNIKK